MPSSAQSFVDEVTLLIRSGAGGDGSASFRREKFVAHGGPDGGDGGRGGDVTFIADSGMNTLQAFRHKKEISATAGEDGRGRKKHGSDGRSELIRVPVGTLIYDADDRREEPVPLADLAEEEQTYVAAKGGNGGWGNVHFKTSTRQAPDHAKPGQPAVSANLRLSLKLIADIGLIGFPNAGKSTLLARISEARPKIANYPFTTLVPQLGVVEVEERRFVVADVPGLIEGASEGAGLGDRFLRHVERTRVLVHLLDVAAMLVEERDLISDYEAIRRELAHFSPAIAERREIVVINKAELIDAENEKIAAVEQGLAERGCVVMRVSSATGAGIPELVIAMLATLDAEDEAIEAARAKEAAAAAEQAADHGIARFPDDPEDEGAA
jgi:GTP-binding protein